MDDLGAVSEPSVQTEKEDNKSKSPETELPQPQDSNPAGQPAEAWKVTAVFPCLTFGQVAEMVDEGNIVQRFTWGCGDVLGDRLMLQVEVWVM
ncbi:hypothetical protein Patl1_18509 [Pistacia atlantica]|uniref:Uncharacterized protein n=1 Tax=Pistacia atlantica TaxID=434234 RepID=A0ACC1C346_9ROSI|nr:hypothetical protein Patl1_18509 [Pistacia atlantica]